MRAAVVIAASPEAVFESLIDPELFARWFGATSTSSPRVGGRCAMGGFDVDPGGMKFVEFEPGRKAHAAVRRTARSTTWELDGSRRQDPADARVRAGSTWTTRRTTGWTGWLSGVADLRRYHEVPDWRTIWRQIEAPGMPAEMLSTDG